MPCVTTANPSMNTLRGFRGKSIGIYPTSSGIIAFAGKLTGYKTSRGAIQIPWDKPVPYDLIAEITRFRVAEVKGSMVT